MRGAPASRLGILEYTGFLWASLFGFAVFREVPNLDTVFGAAIIVAACLVALRRPGRAASPLKREGRGARRARGLVVIR